jgi:hypothetical protein
MTGRNRFTAEELARMDDYAAKADKLSPEQVCALLNKYRQSNHPYARDIVEALSTSLSGR